MNWVGAFFIIVAIAAANCMMWYNQGLEEGRLQVGSGRWVCAQVTEEYKCAENLEWKPGSK